MRIPENLQIPFPYVLLDPCDSEPCLHGGECSRTSSGFVCQCKDQYFGEACEIGLYINFTLSRRVTHYCVVEDLLKISQCTKETLVQYFKVILKISLQNY